LKDYTYLGTIVTNKSKLIQEIKKRIKNSNGAYYKLFPLLKSPKKTEKIKIYKTLKRPVATYRAESWTQNKDVGWLLLKEEF